MRLLDSFSEPLAYVSLLLNEQVAEEAEFNVVQKDLDHLLNQSSRLAANIDHQSFEAGLFAVCAWIDEQLLNSGWQGKNDWLTQPLQKRYFSTLQAGEKFYAYLDALLTTEQKTSADDPAVQNRNQGLQGTDNYSETGRMQALEVYAACLALGFTGRYFRPQDRKIVQELKDKCLRTIQDLGGELETEKLFPEAYPGSQASKGKWHGVFGPGMVVSFFLPVVVLAALYIVYDSMLVDMLQNLLASY